MIENVSVALCVVLALFLYVFWHDNQVYEKRLRLCEARRELHTKAARECDVVLVECESNLGKTQTSYDALWQACRK